MKKKIALIALVIVMLGVMSGCTITIEKIEHRTTTEQGQ